VRIGTAGAGIGQPAGRIGKTVGSVREGAEQDGPFPEAKQYRALTPHEVYVNGCKVNSPQWSRWVGWLEEDQANRLNPQTQPLPEFQLETRGKTTKPSLRGKL